MSERAAPVAHLGMWLFLASEVLLFGALFAVYAGYRVEYATDFARAARESSLVLGSVNTFILLTSSLIAALGVQAYAKGRCRLGGGLLLVTAACGALFLSLKLIEYAEHARSGILPGAHYRSAALATPGARSFFTLYFLMTGLHGLHVLGGMTALGIVGGGALWRGPRAPSPLPVELTVLYWHLVDVIWIFLWPLFYLLH
jgi:cytochrome c oxidase subunit 3